MRPEDDIKKELKEAEAELSSMTAWMGCQKWKLISKVTWLKWVLGEGDGEYPFESVGGGTSGIGGGHQVRIVERMEK